VSSKLHNYQTLGVRTVINASATLTALGGSVMPPEVTAAMLVAAQSHVDMYELHEAVGAELAKLTRNEAAYVTCGCASAITLAVLACITKGDPAAISRMPSGFGLPTEVVMHRAHRIPYDRAIELAGGSIVEIGNMIQTFDWELDAAITQATAAVFWVAGSHLPPTALSLRETVAIAHNRGIPVIVDAAAQLPPVSNLWRFTTEDGADLVLFSGGKALRGPQASGLLLGRRDLVEAARANGAPHQRLARALKVGKEEIMGVLAAVRRYVDLDHDSLLRGWEATVLEWQTQLNLLGGVTASRAFPNEAGEPTPRLRVVIDSDRAGVNATELIQRLWERSPRIAVLSDRPDAFHLTPTTLAAGEAEQVAIAIAEELFRDAANTARPTTTKSEGISL
jgi:D-glucosaminate-6-phosphate ammonia-lyase